VQARIGHIVDLIAKVPLMGGLPEGALISGGSTQPPILM